MGPPRPSKLAGWIEDEDQRQALIHEIVGGAVDGAIRGDSLLLYFLVKRLWNVPL